MSWRRITLWATRQSSSHDKLPRELTKAWNNLTADFKLYFTSVGQYTPALQQNHFQNSSPCVLLVWHNSFILGDPIRTSLLHRWSLQQRCAHLCLIGGLPQNERSTLYHIGILVSLPIYSSKANKKPPKRIHILVSSFWSFVDAAFFPLSLALEELPLISLWILIWRDQRPDSLWKFIIKKTLFLEEILRNFCNNENLNHLSSEYWNSTVPPGQTHVCVCNIFLSSMSQLFTKIRHVKSLRWFTGRKEHHLYSIHSTNRKPIHFIFRCKRISSNRSSQEISWKRCTFQINHFLSIGKPGTRSIKSYWLMAYRNRDEYSANTYGECCKVWLKKAIKEDFDVQERFQSVPRSQEPSGGGPTSSNDTQSKWGVPRHFTSDWNLGR